MQTPHPSQSGRSMVEMLGTLAIIGVLSAGAIGGYSYAMNKHRTNELIYEATKRAQWVGTQLELGSEPSLGTFGTETFGFGEFSGIDNNLPNTHQFGIMVSNLKKGVCDNLVNNLDRSGVIRDVTNVDCGTGVATLVFNRDLSTTDPSETEGESSNINESTGTDGYEPEESASGTTPSDRKVHCNDHGEWDGNACDCDAGYDGETCSIEINAQPDEPEETATGTGDYETEETATGTANKKGDPECNYHGKFEYGICNCFLGWGGRHCSVQNPCGENGHWYNEEGNSGLCHCNQAYGGIDCSHSIEDACNGHGHWECGSRCDCDWDWGGTDCTIENACNNHGRWENYIYRAACSCESGWYGSNCSYQDSREACNGHGSFSYRSCDCDSGWYGYNCTYQDEREACNDHGTYDRNCICDDNWTGTDCSTPQ